MREGHASSTAYLIAGSTLFVAATPALRHLVAPRSAELCSHFIRARRAKGRLLLAMSTGMLRPFGALAERLTVPGIQLHYALRKRRIESCARAALEEGTRQVLVLGAGFDTLALRLCESYPAARFIEIDHPATQRAKLETIADIDAATPAPNLDFIPLDLTARGLEEAILSSVSFRAGERSLFIAEGVLMYLAPAEVDALFGAVSRLCAPASLFAFTFMEERDDGRPGFRNTSRLASLYLRLRGEPFRWGINREHLAGHLAPHGFRVREVVTSETLRRSYLADLDYCARLRLACGESLCIAERA